MFQVQVYPNPVRGNPTNLLADWSKYVSGLRFASSATSGWAECTFTVKLSFEELLAIVEGGSKPPFVTNRILIAREGKTAYEGMIYNLSLTYGSANLARSADQLYTVARADYHTNAGDFIACYSTQAVRDRFGIKVYKTNLSEQYPSNTTTPLKIATRFFTMHSYPPKSDSKRYGRGGEDISLEVSCVGLAATLDWRYAYNGSGGLDDTGQIVKDMIQPGNILAGNDAGNGQRQWNERLTSSDNSANNIPYMSQFISATDFTHIQTTGVSVGRATVAGQTRLEIIQAAAEYGNSNSKRMLFQVWDNPNTVDGKGIAYFQAQPTQRTYEAGYTGYFEDTKAGLVFDNSNQRIPLWQVRAGKWITANDLPSKGYYEPTSAIDDPKMFWIERAEYDADNGELTLATSTEFNFSLYVGRLIRGKRIIREA